MYKSRIGAAVIAGVVAGVVFGAMMQMMSAPTPDGGEMSMLAMVGMIVGSPTIAAGWVYHLFNSAVIGGLFGYRAEGRRSLRQGLVPLLTGRSCDGSRWSRHCDRTHTPGTPVPPSGIKIQIERRPGMSDLPVACTLGPAAIKARREDLLGGLLHRAEERLELANGYQVRFPSNEGMLAAIASVVELERQCCRFLRFELTVDPDGGPIWLELTGPPGTREFLDGMLDL